MSNSLAGKFGYAGGMPERKVRPIWDAIDSRQYKNALKLASSLLTKYPNLPYAMALKALILERMGKPEEALSICLNAKELLHKNVTLLMDDLTLSTLQMVFQRLDRLDLATSLYDYACGKIPNNLELMMGLFNCYVREYAYVKQQQTAIKMYKLVGEERFLLWAVCSIQLQASCGQGGEKLVALAEGLLKKHIASHSLHEPEALIVYISVLEQQGKYGDALEVLSGKLGSLIQIEVDRLRLQGRLLAQSGDNSAAASTFQKILELCPDDWECFLHYLGCLLEDDQSWCNGATNEPSVPPSSVDKLPHITDDVFHSRIQDASAFVRKLETEACGDPKRGLSLAYLEIERRKLLHGFGDKETIIDSVVQYFSRFGYLACFCSDVEVLMDILTPDEKTKLLEKLKESSASMSMVPTKSLGQAISFHKIQWKIGINKLPDAELQNLAIKMVKMYCENLPLSKDLDPQESTHGEDLLYMVSNILVQLYWRTGSIGYLLETVMMLELGLNIKRFVSQYKLMLIHLYSLLGALPVAYEWYSTLDVKNILLESVSHQILPQMLLSPLWDDLNDLLKDYLKFMDDYLRESADLTFLAYRHRNYSKVIEFVQFKERLQHSNQYLVARVESDILRLKYKADNIDEEEGVFEFLKYGSQVLELANDTSCKSLTFNEDMQLRPWWTPTPNKNYLLGPFEEFNRPRENLQDYRKEWETNVREIVEKRSLLPRMIYLSVRCVSASIKENIEAYGSLSDSSISLEIESLLERYAKMLGCSLNEAVKVVLDVAEGRKSLEALGSDLIEWVNFAVFCNAWSLISHESAIFMGEESISLWHVVNSLLQKCITHKVRITGPMVCSPGGDLPVLVQLISEPVAWQCLVLQSFIRSSLPCGKKKKKSGGAADSSISALSQTIRDSILSLYSTVEVVEKWLKDEVTKTDDEALDQLLSSLEQGPNEGPGQVFRVLKDLMSTADEAELGDRNFQGIKSWNPTDIARKMFKGQQKLMLNFLLICESKRKLLEALKQQV